MCSSQHLIILTRLAQLRLHKATHRGIFLNAKDAFPVTRNVHGAMGMRVWEWSLFHRGNSGWIEMEMRGLCHPGPFPEQRDRKWPGILGGYKPFSVCLYQTTIRYFIQMASKRRPLWQRAWRDMSLLHPYHSTAFTGLALWLCVWTVYTSTSLLRSGNNTIQHGLQSRLHMEVKHTTFSLMAGKV